MSSTSFLQKAAIFKLVACLVLVVTLLVKHFGFYNFLIFPLLNVVFDISYFIRTLYYVFMIRLYRVKQELLETSTTSFWVFPTDIDFMGLMNNSR